jgi:pectate lyase
MPITNDGPVGFGQQVNGGLGARGGNSATVRNKQQLRTALLNLSAAPPPEAPVRRVEIIIFPAATGDDYDFKNEDIRAFTIREQNVTLRGNPGQRVELKNIGLVLDLASIDNILIQNLAFSSDGSKGVPKDGILFDGENSSAGFTNRVRITHCSFDGYLDQAIEIRSSLSKLLATIDRCYFVDSHPGARPPFVKRGAINIASDIDEGTRVTGNSFVTVAYNYFENIWRRNPRAAADGTRVHIFNNLLYQWGFGNKSKDKTTWNGIEIETLEQLEGRTTTPENAVTASIQANRFIPWVDKESKAIDIDTGTIVDIGPTSLANRFDNPSGVENAEGPLKPTGTFTSFDLSKWYTDMGLMAPDVIAPGSVGWAALAGSAGAVELARSVPSVV